MKHIIFLLGILMLGSIVRAQSDVHYSMFKLNRQIFNPAVTGANNAMTFTSHMRDQWGNFPGAPRTYTFQVHAPFYQDRVGMGLSFVSEEIGIVKSNIASFNYAYHIKFTERSTIRVGVLGQLEHGNIRWEMVEALDNQDVTIGMASSRFSGNFGAGVFYELGEFYVGLSVPRFLKNTFYNRTGSIDYNMLNLRTYYLQMGTAFKLSKNLALAPGVLISANPSSPFEFDLNVNLLMYDRIGIGFGYRLQDSADAILQYKLNKQFKIAAGFDFTLSGLQEHAPASFEVLLQYELNYEDDGVYNIRFF